MDKQRVKDILEVSVMAMAISRVFNLNKIVPKGKTKKDYQREWHKINKIKE